MLILLIVRIACYLVDMDREFGRFGNRQEYAELLRGLAVDCYTPDDVTDDDRAGMDALEVLGWLQVDLNQAEDVVGLDVVAAGVDREIYWRHAVSLIGDRLNDGETPGQFLVNALWSGIGDPEQWLPEGMEPDAEIEYAFSLFDLVTARLEY